MINRRTFIHSCLASVGAGAISAGEENSPPLKIGLIADPQYCDHPKSGSRDYRKSLNKLKEAVKAFKEAKVDCVVTLGDLIDRDFKSFGPVMKEYHHLGKIPHYPILGNHDWSVDPEHKAKVIDAMQMSAPYYAKVSSSWRLIFLDSTDVASFRPESKSTAIKQLAALKATGAPNAQPWNSALGTDQLKWLNSELEAATKADQQVILFNHCPIAPAKDSHNLWNDQVLRQLIAKRPCVKAYLNGHNHSGNYAQAQGCHFLNLKGMVETSDSNAFAIATCSSNQIKIQGFGREPSRELLLTRPHS